MAKNPYAGTTKAPEKVAFIDPKTGNMSVVGGGNLTDYQKKSYDEFTSKGYARVDDANLITELQGKIDALKGKGTTDWANAFKSIGGSVSGPTQAEIDAANARIQGYSAWREYAKPVTEPIQTNQEQSPQTIVGVTTGDAGNSNQNEPSLGGSSSGITGGNLYNEQAQLLINQLKQKIAEARAQQEGIIKNAPQQFDPLRAQSELAKGQQLRSVLERNANLGDRGGIGRSAALQTQTAGENRLNAINLQQQNVIDTANQQIAQLESQGKFEEANIISQQKLAELQALMAQQQRQDEIARQDSIRAQEIARQDKLLADERAYEQSQIDSNRTYNEAQQAQAQERADFQTKIMANYQNISQFVNQLKTSGAPQWQIDQAEAARIQKVIENNLDPKTGKPLAVDNTQAIWDQALTKWNAGIPLTSQEMQVLGTPTATKPVKTSGGSSGSTTTVTQDRNYQMDRWEILGVADQAISQAWGVPVGTPVSNAPQETTAVDIKPYRDYVDTYLVNEDEITGKKTINRQGVAKYIYDLLVGNDVATADALAKYYGITEQEIEVIERSMGNRR